MECGQGYIIMGYSYFTLVQIFFISNMTFSLVKE